MNKKEQLSAYSLRKFPYRLNWEITQDCNFRCSYCSNPVVNKSDPPSLHSPEEIKSFFDRTGVQWLILITGGEPFLYPNFVNVCSELAKNHSLQITTNLSRPEVYEFANKISPKKVFNISASYHREERHRPGLKDDFIKKSLELKNKGFNILINILAYPPLIHTVENDIAMFESQGLETMLFGYRGTYKGKKYPEAYTRDELELLKKYAIDDTEIKIAFNQLNYYGRYCAAGSSYFSMDQHGNLGRCFTLTKKIGNLFDGDISLNHKAKPCIATQCEDCYNGPASITKRKASGFSIWLEKRKDKMRRDMIL